jgi:hypothetical protein
MMAIRFGAVPLTVLRASFMIAPTYLLDALFGPVLRGSMGESGPCRLPHGGGKRKRDLGGELKRTPA